MTFSITGDFYEYGFKLGAFIVSFWSAIFAFYTWRKGEMRRADVLKWADKCIEQLQTLVIITKHVNRDMMSDDVRKAKLFDIAINVSVLSEQGRLLYKNTRFKDDHLSNKLPAFLGYRPVVLDPLIDAFTIAKHWHSEKDEGKNLLANEARYSEQTFVSYLQKNVGRRPSFAGTEGAAGSKTLDVNGLKNRAIERMQTN